MEPSKIKVAIIGGGLVGAMNACFFGQRGYQVHLFEMREDIRLSEKVVGRSINMALSYRGREALRAIDMEEKVLAAGIPMYARMIHEPTGRRRPIRYGRKNQHIVAVDRRRLNELLLTSAEENPNVMIHFKHKFISCDFENGKAVFEIQNDARTQFTDDFDLIVGNDGAYSAVRNIISKTTRFNYTQEYIQHGYMELVVPPGPNNTFLMEKNYLHIWPRNDFMMIAIPNPDGSFTGTLFMPFAIFESLKNEKDLIEFYEKHFPDALQFIGRERLCQLYFSNHASAVVTVKCHPYNVGSRCVLMGDAAHAMVPFYGQGMNCGFEDCLIFHQILNECEGRLKEALDRFTQERHEDAKTICDLSFYNYIEMRKSVNSWTFLMRKYLDNFLNILFPRTWIPLYTMVAFSRIPYSQCLRNRQWQDKVLRAGLVTLGLSAVGLCVYKMNARRQLWDICQPIFAKIIQ